MRPFLGHIGQIVQTSHAHRAPRTLSPNYSAFRISYDIYFHYGIRPLRIYKRYLSVLQSKYRTRFHSAAAVTYFRCFVRGLTCEQPIVCGDIKYTAYSIAFRVYERTDHNITIILQIDIGSIFRPARYAVMKRRLSSEGGHP